MNFRVPSGARPSSDKHGYPRLSFTKESAVFREGEGAGAEALQQSKTIFIAEPPVDQGIVPCCVAVALTTLIRAVGGGSQLSPLFNYFFSRRDRGVLDDVQPALAFSSAAVDGICREALHNLPFDEPSALQSPSASALADAPSHLLQLTALGLPPFGTVSVMASEWQGAIAKNLPVLVAFFMSPEYDAIRNGTTIEHAQPTTFSGFGHAVVAVGYDDAARHFLIRDSRGTGVGAAGVWHLPYDRLGDGFIFESWVITEVP